MQMWITLMMMDYLDDNNDVDDTNTAVQRSAT
uniref:Uncharacterized protein n=1 Tax=Arundo donax TaxID=35708 RepID=A0A0A9AL78_ARUDO